MEDIDKNKIIVQRTPKNSENLSFKNNIVLKQPQKFKVIQKYSLRKKHRARNKT